MKLELTSKTERTHRTVFQERYEWLLGWALKLTRGDREEAEDILHDTYIQFLRLAPPLHTIDNVDAYLNRMVRNLHLSRVTRRSRVPMVQLDAVDYDSASLSVAAVDPFRLLPLQRDLHNICDWGCARRSKTRAASVLLLRYFLGYLPSEIGRLCLCNRQSIEKSLQLARREIRAANSSQELHEREGKRTAIKGSNLQQLQLRSVISRSTASMAPMELESSLLTKIFSEPLGACIPLIEMQALYQRAEQIDTATLAHLTSCLACLDRANRLLGLSTMAERSMMEGRDGDPPAGDIPVSTARVIPRGDRSIRKIYEHRPAQLTVQVDAGRRVSVAIQSHANHFDVEVGRTQPVSFIEVFSEQEVRLMYLPVVRPEDGGEFLQETTTTFSEDRLLRVGVRFTQPRATITLSYIDPLFREMQDTGLQLATAPGARFVLSESSLLPQLHNPASGTEAWMQRAWSWMRTPFRSIPRAISFVTALLLVVLVPLIQTRDTTAEAQMLLTHAEDWQRNVTPRVGIVLHRSFDYFELPNVPGPAQRKSKYRRVEIWREPASGRKFSQLFDDSGKLLESASGPTIGQPEVSDAWRFEPSSDTFKMAATTDRMKVLQTEAGYEIKTDRAEIYLAKESYRPVHAVLHLADRNVEFNERTTEAVPVDLTPLAEPHALAATSSGEAARTVIDLDRSEMQVRSKLHDLQADLGEDIHVSRTVRGVEVAGIIAPDDRRSQLVAGLRGVPGVLVELRSPEQAIAQEHHTAIRVVDASGAVGREAAPLLESWLKSKYPDEQERSISVQHVLTLADQCIFRAHALDRLAKRYGGFNDPTVSTMATDHEKAIREAARSIEQWLAQVPQPDTGASQSASINTASLSTEDRTDLLVRTSQDLERDLANLVASGAEEHGPEPPQAAEALARCRKHIRELVALTESIH